MTCRSYLRFGILALLGTVCLSCKAYPQSQSCIDAARPTPQKTKITVVSVEFEGENPLSDAQRDQLTNQIQQQDIWTAPEEPDSNWVNQALEPMRDTLRAQGYFKTNLHGTPYLVLARANERNYVLSVMIDAGPKYKLGKLTFASAANDPLHFTDAELREQMNLQEGELLNGEKIRKGLESIGRLYGTKGYIDATPEPDTTVDEKESRIDLLIKIDEQKPYRIAEIELLSSDTTSKNESRIPQERGDVFKISLWRDFFEENKSHLPAGASPNKNMRILRDTAKSTVDMTLDFRPCPKT